MALDSNNRESDKITNDFESLKDLLMQTTKVIVNYKDMCQEVKKRIYSNDSSNPGIKK